MLAEDGRIAAEREAKEAKKETRETKKEVLKEKQERAEEAQVQQEKITEAHGNFERAKTAEAELWAQLDRKEISAERHKEHWERADEELEATIKERD